MFTYSGDPSSCAKDAVRFLIGDTDSSEPLLQDGEIQYFLGQYNNAPLNAAIRCCEAIMTKLARQCDESVGPVRLTFSQRSKAYQTMVRELQRRLAMEGCKPFAGGISKTDIQVRDLDADRVKPDFTKHQMENDQIAPWVSKPVDEFVGTEPLEG